MFSYLRKFRLLEVAGEMHSAADFVHRNGVKTEIFAHHFFVGQCHHFFKVDFFLYGEGMHTFQKNC